MTLPYAKLRVSLLVLALVTSVAEGVPQGWAGQDVRACDVLDIQGASRVIRPSTEHPGGDTEQLTCLYSNPGVAMLTIQLWPAEEK